jgi:hypothetical protein
VVEVRIGGARMRRGIYVPNGWLAHPFVALVPGVPPFSPVAPRRGRLGLVMVRAFAVSPSAIGVVVIIIAGPAV